MRLNLAKKIIVGSLFIALLGVVVCVYSVTVVGHLSEKTNDLETRALPLLYDTNTAARDSILKASYLRAYVITGNKEMVDKYYEVKKNSDEIVQSLIDNAITEEGKQLSTEVQKLNNEYSNIAENKFLPLLEQGKKEEAIKVMNSELVPSATKGTEKINEYISFRQEQISGVLSGVSDETRKIRTNIFTFTVVLILASLISSILLARTISGPIRKLKYISDELANGNLNVDVNVTSNDEIGDLANSMKILTKRLIKYIDYIEEISDNLNLIGSGDLNINLSHEYDGEFEVLKDALLKTTENFKKTISDISQVSIQVANGADQVSSGAQMLAQGTTEQASSIEELAATINNISENVNKNANSAREASSYVKNVGDSANVSSSKMNEMMIAIKEINEKSYEIGKIVKTIDDIAFQTNILALNAAVEAARAGSAGKGFAVVADEVRNLAIKSSEAAKNTTQLIEDSVNSVQAGTLLAADTNDALIKVIEGVAHSVELIEDISQASGIQAKSLEETLNGLEQVGAVVHTNSATAEESSATSEELLGQSTILKSLILKFKL